MRKSRFGPAIVQPSTSENEGFRRHVLTAEERGQLLNDKPKPMEVTPSTSTAEQVKCPPVVPEVIIKTESDDTPTGSAPEPRALNFIKLPECLNFDR